MSFSDWSTTNSENTSVGPVNIAERCPPGNLNDAIREVMAEMRSAINPSLDPSLADGTVGAPTGSLASIALLGTVADRLIYTTNPKTFAEATLTAFARTLLAGADASAIRALLGTPSVAGASLASPGFVKIALPAGGVFMVAWGTATANPNGYTNINYATAFPTASYAVFSGGTQDTGASDNDPFVQFCGPVHFSLFSARDASVSGWYIAVGY